MRNITGIEIGLIAGIIGVSTVGITSSAYIDFPGYGDKYQTGRTKNAVASVVAGVVAHKMYENASIDLEVQKPLWPDAKLTGTTTQNAVDTYVDLMFTSSQFQATADGRGYLSGEVKKSDFNWNVQQSDQNTYEMSRFGHKFDSGLHITVSDGVISGTYTRTGPHFDWNISGTYDTQGNVMIDIDHPTILGITLEGKITEKQR